MTEREASAGQNPKFFDLLSDEDKAKYEKLRATLSSSECRNRRGKRLESFQSMLNTIQTFCIQNDEDDWKRCLACGVCWLEAGLAINTRHLSLLIDKCKSSINGSLQKMGYATITSRSESSSLLIDAIPFLKNNFTELREWTIRQPGAMNIPHQVQPYQYTSATPMTPQPAFMYPQMMPQAQPMMFPNQPQMMFQNAPLPPQYVPVTPEPSIKNPINVNPAPEPAPEPATNHFSDFNDDVYSLTPSFLYNDIDPFNDLDDGLI